MKFKVRITTRPNKNIHGTNNLSFHDTYSFLIREMKFLFKLLFNKSFCKLKRRCSFLVMLSLSTTNILFCNLLRNSNNGKKLIAN